MFILKDRHTNVICACVQFLLVLIYVDVCVVCMCVCTCMCIVCTCVWLQCADVITGEEGIGILFQYGQALIQHLPHCYLQRLILKDCGLMPRHVCTRHTALILIFSHTLTSNSLPHPCAQIQNTFTAVTPAGSTAASVVGVSILDLSLNAIGACVCV